MHFIILTDAVGFALQIVTDFISHIHQHLIEVKYR